MDCGLLSALVRRLVAQHAHASASSARPVNGVTAKPPVPCPNKCSHCQARSETSGRDCSEVAERQASSGCDNADDERAPCPAQ